MSSRPIVIIHGWSDSAASFVNLGRILQQRTARPIQEINLANYISMDDNVTMEDLVAAMHQAWLDAKLSILPQSNDILVHSTGGLIIRAWMLQYFKPDTVPIKHLVMLAPANFGSPLAHKGRSLIGRILKGWNNTEPFQTGTYILKALELASPYTWQLAMQDRFGATNFFDQNKVLCTVLIGTSGFSGIAAAANDPGTDGVVRFSCANLNCALLRVDFITDPKHPSYQLQMSNGQIGFGLIENENHDTITANNGGPRNPNTLNTIVQALELKDGDFASFCQHLTTNNSKILQNQQQAGDNLGYQNTVTKLSNQYQQPVHDYFMEFYGDGDRTSLLAKLFHGELIETVHAYSDDNSYRSLFINCKIVDCDLQKSCSILNISLTALPAFSQSKLVGYNTYDKTNFGALEIPSPKIAELFQANRTLLMDIKIMRHQAPQLFRINPLTQFKS